MDLRNCTLQLLTSANMSLGTSVLSKETGGCNFDSKSQSFECSSPHRLVVRTSRRGRDNPGSTPGEDICCESPHLLCARFSFRNEVWPNGLRFFFFPGRVGLGSVVLPRFPPCVRVVSQPVTEFSKDCPNHCKPQIGTLFLRARPTPPQTYV